MFEDLAKSPKGVDRRVSSESLEGLMIACFRTAGFAAQSSELIAHHLIEAEQMGVASHGVMRLHSYLDQVQAGHIDPQAKPSSAAGNNGLVSVNGQGGIGILAMEYALDLAMERSQTLGVSVAGVVNCGHTGRIGAYAQRAAAAGFVALCLGGGGRRKWSNVAPFGAAEGAMSTNPIAVGFPGAPDNEPFSDFATSNISTGKVSVCHTNGTLLPKGAAIDKSGQPTQVPESVLDGGFLTPSGGAKGSGLGIFSELVGDALLGSAHEFNWLLIVIRGDGFRPLPKVRQDSAAFVDNIRSLRPAEGFDRVLAPGDPERIRARQCRETGIVLNEGVWAKIVTAARSVGVDPYAVLERTGEETSIDA